MGVLTQSALVAAHEAIIPVDVGFFSVAGLARIVSIIDDIRNTYNPELKIAGVLATKYDPRTTLSETTVSEIRAQRLPMFDTKIRISVDIIRSQMARVPVSIYATESHGAEDYNALAAEMLPGKVIPLRQRRRGPPKAKRKDLAWRNPNRSRKTANDSRSFEPIRARSGTVRGL